MAITDESIAEVRAKSDIVAVANQFTQLKKVGTRWSGLCPFHGEKTPSFSINAEDGVYYCFGCQAKGDTIRLVAELQHLDFPEAVEWLAGQSGVTLQYTERSQGEQRKKRSALTETVEKAVSYYHDRLLNAPDAGVARAYLRQRGFTSESVRRFRLGWAPDDWDQLARHLQVSDKILTESGLGFVNKARRQQDFFRGRVLFPIFDAQDSAIGFGGRVMPGGDGPKYRNTGQTALYDKSKVLYGLNWARSEIVTAEEVVICEGYTDVIGLSDVGVPWSVATCGTSLTQDHVRLLRRFARRIVLAFDPDAAGAAAAERVYAWEAAHDLEVVVAALPVGQDPGDLSRSGPELLRKAIAEPVPFLGFRVERVLTAGRFDTPEGRARTASNALDVIREHPSDLVRDQYVMEVADRCRIDVERLRANLKSVKRSVAPAPEAPPTRLRSDAPEAVALRLAVDPEHRSTMLPMLHEVLFNDDLNVRVLRALQASAGDLHAALELADPAAADALRQFSVQDESNDPTDVRRLLMRQAAGREVEHLRRQLRAASDAEATELSPVLAWLMTRIEQIAPDARSGPEVEEQLLGWLAERAEERP